MSPLDFLAVVLPSSGHGHYCVAELTTKRKQHIFQETLTALSNPIDRFIERKLDTYMALATFAGDSEGRKATNAAFMRSIFIDIDCNHKLDLPGEDGTVKAKAYPSSKAAVQALASFLEESGLSALGDPLLVSSGGGVHAYWPLTDDVAIEDWRPVAENFKSLCVQYRLGIDPTVTADPARVMRLPGSVNTGVKGFKQVRGATRCRIVAQGDTFVLADFARIVRDKLVARTYEDKQPRTLALPGKRLAAANAPITPMLKSSVGEAHTSFSRIVKRSAAGTGCAQLAHYLQNPQADGLEPLWRGLLSWAKCCEGDGWKSAQKLSALHPYSPERLEAKWVELKGPYPCAKMDSENPGVCDGCPHQGKIVNALALGRIIPEDTAVREVALPLNGKAKKAQPVSDGPDEDEDEDEDDLPAHRIRRPDPPKGFGYTRGGGVFMRKIVPGGEDEEDTKDLPLLPYDFFIVRMLRNQTQHMVHFLYTRPEGPVDIILPQRTAVSRDEALKALAEQNVIAMFGQGNDKNLFEYVRACVNNAATGEAVRVPDHGGWQDDDTYVHGGQVYAPSLPPTPLPMPGLENINYAMQPQGSPHVWRQFMDMLVRKELYDILAIFLISAGAPLMRFTGISGMTFHFTSRASGTGKSLGLDAAASIWGQPSRYRVNRDTSPVAMQQRLGLLNSEPLITDEITQKNRGDDMEWLPSFLFDMAEGKGKERMEAGANKERVNTTYWNTVAMLTSNNPAVDYLTGTRAHSSEGELRRLLELVMEKQLEWAPAEVELIKALKNNCGHLGPKLIQYMVDNVEEVSRLTNETTNHLYRKMSASGDERFWMAGISCAMTAGVLLSDKVTGLMPLPLAKIQAVYQRMLDSMREHTRSGQRSAADILGMFIRENYGSFVSIIYVDSKPTVAGGSVDLTQNKSLARLKIMGRVERGIKQSVADIFIEERVMRAFCASKSFGYADFRVELAKTFDVSYGYKNLTAKTDGPDMRVRSIRIAHPEDALDDPSMAVNLTPKVD